jgi:hypothetical protein
MSVSKQKKKKKKKKKKKYLAVNLHPNMPRQ